MDRYRKIVAYLIIGALIFSIIPLPALGAENTDAATVTVNKSIVQVFEEPEKAIIYEEDNKESKQLFQIENGTEINVLEKGAEFTYIQYEIPEKSQISVGYIESKFLVPFNVAKGFQEYEDSTSSGNDLSQMEEEPINYQSTKGNENQIESLITNSVDHDTDLAEKQQIADGDITTDQSDSKQSKLAYESSISTSGDDKLDGITIQNPTNVFAEPSTSSNVIKVYNKGSILELFNYSEEWYVISFVENGISQAGYIKKRDIEIATANPELQQGITLNASTNMYSSPSRSSNVLKIYSEGSQLKYYTYTSEWYKSSVNVNGVTQTVYIHKDDVDNVTINPILQEGFALKNPTIMYDSPSRNSQVTRTFIQGSYLLFYTYTSNWYKSTISVNGKNQTIYINKEDVEKPTDNPELQKGISLKDPINMYSSPKRDSQVLRTYPLGATMQYFTYSSGWYKSSINYNGSPRVVYISRDDLDRITDTPVLQEGFALNNPTKMYASPSNNSQVIRTFDQGSYLLFYTYTSNWYKSTVSVNGKNQTIYINKEDVERPTENPKLQKGISLKDPINMYSSPKRGSKVLRTYPLGATIQYFTYSSGWYKSSINYNGAPHVVYISRDDVDQITDTPVLQEGFALKNPTKMYALPAQTSKILRTYSPGTVLKFYSFTSNWYKSAITVAGKSEIIYIYKDDVEKLSRSTKILQGLSLKSPTNVYSLPSTEAKVLRQYSKDSILKFYDYSKNWYKSSINVNGKTIECYFKKSDIGEQRKTYYDLTLDQAVNMQKEASPVTDSGSEWRGATSLQIEYYLDPLNFGASSDTYLQFLILSNPAGTNATELNNRILYGKGVLAGKGSSYIKAAQTYHINEIYLISHSLLETGNGKSQLATGIKVNGVTVYNVYGVGAYDSNPDYYGAKFAYEHGWTTIEKAIIGGAQFAAEKYIHAGQDTLYKMRWNPEAMDTYGSASHQYATDIGWAVKQTTRMAQMLSTLTQFTLLYDIPVYQ